MQQLSIASAAPVARKAKKPKAKRNFDLTPKKPTARSKYGNGARLMSGDIDRRTLAYREFIDICGDLVAHLGGEPTAPELLLVQEAAALSVWCRSARVSLIKGDGTFDIGGYTTACNSLRRLLQDLGQEQRLRDVSPPTIEAYLAHTAQKAAA